MRKSASLLVSLFLASCSGCQTGRAQLPKNLVAEAISGDVTPEIPMCELTVKSLPMPSNAYDVVMGTDRQFLELLMDYLRCDKANSSNVRTREAVILRLGTLSAALEKLIRLQDIDVQEAIREVEEERINELNKQQNDPAKRRDTL